MSDFQNFVLGIGNVLCFGMGLAIGILLFGFGGRGR